MNISQEKSLLHCTSMIHTEDSYFNSEQATCFFLKRTVGNTEHHYLVTCAHVLKNAVRIHIYLDYYHRETDRIEHYKKITLAPKDAVRIHPDCDLALLCIDSIRNKNTDSDYYLYSPVDINTIPDEFDTFSSFQPILMLGYPSGIHDSTTNLPIARTGITATPLYSSYKGKPEFLINIPFLNGSSGSPVFAIKEDIPYLIGIEYSKLMEKVTLDKLEARLYRSKKVTRELETGLGIAIRADQILVLLSSSFHDKDL
ncbi:MAG: trypsin-like peptidase domain-containing protein [Lachnospiraceae bacterium]|nr:trypsin-like peptidase domain-containing protein [Lachnospiraceae bacterium]